MCRIRIGIPYISVLKKKLLVSLGSMAPIIFILPFLVQDVFEFSSAVLSNSLKIRKHLLQ